MPPSGEEVLIVVDGPRRPFVVVAVWYGSDSFAQAYDLYEGDTYATRNVTHWMPLPEPP